MYRKGLPSADRMHRRTVISVGLNKDQGGFPTPLLAGLKRSNEPVVVGRPSVGDRPTAVHRLFVTQFRPVGLNVPSSRKSGCILHGILYGVPRWRPRAELRRSIPPPVERDSNHQDRRSKHEHRWQRRKRVVVHRLGRLIERIGAPDLIDLDKRDAFMSDKPDVKRVFADHNRSLVEDHNIPVNEFEDELSYPNHSV